MGSNANTFRAFHHVGLRWGKRLLKATFVTILIVFGLLSFLQIAFALIMWLYSNS